jgi:hypothetical protein
MTSTIVAGAATPAEARAAHVAAWDAVAQEQLADRIGPAYDALIERMPPRAGADSWLDVASGTGPLALRVARAGANVTAFDFAERPLRTARERAAAEDLLVIFDRRPLDHHRYVPEEFTAVASAFGAMYASDHRRAANVVSMLTHPAGRIGLVAWTRDSFAARAFELVQPFAQAWGGAEAPSPFLWGDAAYIDDLFGDFWRFEHAVVELSLGPLSGEEVWSLFAEADGPTAAAAASLEPRHRKQLTRRFVELADEARSPIDGVIAISALVSVGQHPVAE